MADSDVAFAGPARQAEMVRAGEVSPRELVTLYLKRIEELDSKLNAFRVVRAEQALEEADEAERRRGSADDAPLLGVPIAVKDTVDVAGEVTTLGTGAVDGPAREDSEVVRRLRAAGAIVIGKTNLPELAFAMFTESPTWGITRNPWDVTRVPRRILRRQRGRGGGGTRLGGDGVGRRRLHPHPRRILRAIRPEATARPGATRPAGRALARDVRQRLPDAKRPRHRPAPGRHGRRRPRATEAPAARAAVRRRRRESPGKLRIAVSPKVARALAPPMLDERCRRALDETAELLRSLGHDVTPRDPDYGGVGNQVSVLYMRGIADDAASLPHPDRLGKHTRQLARLGRLYPDIAVRRARAVTKKYAARINAIFDHCDVLLTPTIGEPPVPVGKWDSRRGLWTLAGMTRRTGFTPPWNYLGNPAAAVPAGFTREGLPLSVQLVGRPDDEATLLSLAAQIEAERPWADRRPPVS